jgi:Berberine and berberine like
VTFLPRARATTSTGSASLKLDSDPLGSQFLNDLAEALDAIPHALSGAESYPRLQQAKARWDRRDVFRHALSMRLPPSARTKSVGDRSITGRSACRRS